MADNVLGTRRTALALLGLQATPMVPGVNASDSNPQKANGHIINTNTRTLFPAWPADSVVKVRDTSTAALKNALTLRCTPSNASNDSLIFAKTDKETDATGVELGSVIGAVWNPNNWGNGDNKTYLSATVYYNIYLGKIDHDNDPNTPDVDAWDVYIIEFESVGAGGLSFVSSTNIAPSLSEYTTPNAFTDNSLFTLSDVTAYITYNSPTTYDGAFSTFRGPPTYPAVSHVFCARDDADDPHGLKEYIEASNANQIVQADYNSGFFTYVLDGSNTDGGYYQRALCKGRWHYAPDAGNCGTCAYAGKTVTIEAKFKQATVSRTVLEWDTDPNNPYINLTLGTWSDHSTQTFTLTLPDTLTAGDIGTEFDFPTAAGKVVVLDDLRLVSIA